MTHIRSNYADLGDGIVHYLSAGDGPLVVLLHGIAQTSHEWRHVIPHLAGSFRVIAPDRCRLLYRVPHRWGLARRRHARNLALSRRPCGRRDRHRCSTRHLDVHVMSPA